MRLNWLCNKIITPFHMSLTVIWNYRYFLSFSDIPEIVIITQTKLSTWEFNKVFKWGSLQDLNSTNLEGGLHGVLQSHSSVYFQQFQLEFQPISHLTVNFTDIESQLSVKILCSFSNGFNCLLLCTVIYGLLISTTSQQNFDSFFVPQKF